MDLSKATLINFKHDTSGELKDFTVQHDVLEDILLITCTGTIDARSCESNKELSSGVPSFCEAEETCENGVTNFASSNAVISHVQHISELNYLNNYKYLLCTDSALASAISFTCRRSNVFAQSFTNYCKHHGTRERRQSLHTSSEGDVKTVIVVSMHDPENYWLDFYWNYILLSMVYKHIAFEDGMAWLNTLGGGYSALGDYFTRHAKSAAQVSLQQLKIAVEVGDPGMIIRCRLYYALSLMQRGHLRKSKYIIRHLYRNEAKVKCQHDHRLHAMCHGLWNRLKYCYAVRATRESQRMLNKPLNISHSTNGITASS